MLAGCDWWISIRSVDNVRLTEILETFPRVFCFRKSRINENGGNDALDKLLLSEKSLKAWGILQSRLKIFPFVKDARFETSSVLWLVLSCSRFCDSAHRSPSDGLLHLRLRWNNSYQIISVVIVIVRKNILSDLIRLRRLRHCLWQWLRLRFSIHTRF